ncbi:hypothetical protein EAH73_15485 [Hymenobacter nivis]|uniref:DUF4157 domain-containing protein n=1 Tax=Hymenobacter nivis TaxID=1850093 RepID=A0A502GT24_9BACT|nr:hypothetical protein EAH73_15485 [Hymenobacter nivis]
MLLLVTALLVLNPGFLYANRTATPHYTIYHNRPLDPALLPRLEQARAIDQQSSWFDPTLRLNICLNDGSAYPGLVEKLRGPAFGWSIYRSVVLNGEANPQANYVALNGYKWDFVQLLAHEAAHCYQLRRLGIWQMNPLIPQHPMWKLEGYAEYVARRGPNYLPLRQQVQQLRQAQQAAPHEWGIALADGTTASREYAGYLALTTYCLDVKKMTYQQLLADTTSEQTVHRQLASWYQRGEGK